MDFRKSILRFVRVGFRRTENPKIRSEGLPKNETPKIHDRMGFRVPKNGKIPRFVRTGFCVEKPRFDRVEWASDLWEKKNQDSIGWASDLWEKRNQDSIGWSGLPTFGKRRTKIRLGCLRCLLKNGKNQRFVSSGGLLKNNQRFVYTNT
ncbi:unnamed protein product [Rhizophagus irregularis]|uniref:Uncharacterized protein n=1 Tax=Rhizophagus irregularis TaxID=588596 RepID=A0A915YX16_9GLOM|nr:unnamed protein product [Rhizophagus irregularis]